ncbi:MAG: CYTH domain-containing protein [candidate division WOR-3 bacterium]
MRKCKEIERKFLVNKLFKSYKKLPCNLIIQGYITISNNGLEVRIRKIDNKVYLTIKSIGDLIRDEREIQLSQKQLRVLWPITKGRRIEKIRYKIKSDNKIIYLDIYKGKLKGLKIAEVEFKSVKEAKKFKPPEWFGKEVTYDKRYKNKNLAIYGKP